MTEEAAGTAFPEVSADGREAEKASDSDSQNEEETTVTVYGPYGSLSLSIPEGWTCEICNVDDERLMAAEYGIQFAPAGEESGYIEAGYHTSFGVCGTGLEEVETTLAGETVQIGYFDKSKTWDFVSFSSSAKGHGRVVALPFYCETWSEREFDEALSILDTLVYNEDELTGGTSAALIKQEEMSKHPQ
jgi:hypothetical protein